MLVPEHAVSSTFLFSKSLCCKSMTPETDKGKKKYRKTVNNDNNEKAFEVPDLIPQALIVLLL